MTDTISNGSRREFLALMGLTALGTSPSARAIAAGSVGPMPIWLQAQDTRCVSPLMIPASQVGLPEAEALHDEPVVAVTPDGAHIVSTFSDGRPAALAHRFGRGRVVYLPGRFDSMQCHNLFPTVERLFANAVRWVALGELPVEIEAAGPAALSRFRQPRQLIVHLVNHQRDSRTESGAFTRIESVAERLALPEDVVISRVRRLWEDRDLAFSLDGRSLRVPVGTLDEYEAVAVEW